MATKKAAKKKTSKKKSNVKKTNSKKEPSATKKKIAEQPKKKTAKKSTSKTKTKKTTSSKKSTKKEPKKTTIKKKQENLIPDDDYLKSGVHIGIKNKTSFMKEFIYKIRPDGLSIFDVKKINDRLRIICDYLSQFEPEEILVVCKRDNGHKPVKMLGLSTGINTTTGRYLPGTLTNPNNEYFIEPKVVMVTDTWYDKQVVKDAVDSGAVIIALCNTSTVPINVDIVMPCNNRGSKSLGLIYWIIAREYCKNHKKKFDYTVEQFS